MIKFSSFNTGKRRPQGSGLSGIDFSREFVTTSDRRVTHSLPVPVQPELLRVLPVVGEEADRMDQNVERSPGLPRWFWDEYELETLDGNEMFELSLEFVDSSFSLLSSEIGNDASANYSHKISTSMRQLLRATGLLALAMRNNFSPSTLDLSDWLARQNRILSHLPFEVDAAIAKAFEEGVKHANAMNRNKLIWQDWAVVLTRVGQAVVEAARDIVKIVKDSATGIGVGVGIVAALFLGAVIAMK